MIFLRKLREGLKPHAQFIFIGWQMNKTKEIRWFFKKHHQALYNSLNNWNKNAQNTNRTDYYFKIFNENYFGVKLREGRLEIKKRIAKPQDCEFSPNVKGFMEEWIKYETDIIDFEQKTEESSPQFIPVEKERLALYFHKKDGFWKAEINEESLPAGCQIEYSKLKVNGEAHYSFCLEWFGNKYIEMEHEIIRDILGEIKLERKNSMGYPKFLSRYIPI